MQYGIIIQSGDARTFSELACEAEAAGWDAVFIPDAIDIGFSKDSAYPLFDPWVVLAGMAMRTERIRIGTILTPVSRRRPWKLARETTTLDHLSGGRLILAVGLGAAEHDGGFYKVGEAMELKVRAKLVDESLEILGGLWSGKPFSFSGEHYNMQEMTMLPRPVQSPRIPVWVVGVWPKQKSMERALRWDGIIPQKYKATGKDMALSPDGRSLISVDGSGNVVLWRIDSQAELVQWASSHRYLRDLTCSERDLYQLEPLCDAGGQ
jgi:hypothetical protein